MATNNSWNSLNPVEIAKGGTNATTMATTSGIVKYDGTRLVTSSAATIDSSNRLQNTAQPCFRATFAAGASNVTGDGTSYQVAWSATSFDQGSNFTTGASAVFTAPVAGKYLFTAHVSFTGVVVANTLDILLIASGTTFDVSRATGLSGTQILSGSIIVSMAANDTAQVNIVASGGTKVVGVQASASNSGFYGYLVC